MSALSTHATLHRCPNCRAVTIHALDDPRCALEVRLDPIPLTIVTEIQARLRGLLTYDLVPRPLGTHIIIPRDTFRITERQHTILATHQCPGPIHAMPTIKNERAAANDQCPF